METLEKIQKLEKTSQYKEWHQKNPDTFLSYVMRIIENPSNNEWQIGFFCKKKENFTTFIMNNDTVKIERDQEAFRKGDEIVKEIETPKIKYSLVEAAKLAQHLQQEKYPTEKPLKIISILQNLPEINNIWNFSFVTKSFNTLNIKVSAEDGKIIKHTLSQIFDFT